MLFLQVPEAVGRRTTISADLLTLLVDRQPDWTLGDWTGLDIGRLDQTGHWATGPDWTGLDIRRLDQTGHWATGPDWTGLDIGRLDQTGHWATGPDWTLGDWTRLFTSCFPPV